MLSVVLLAFVARIETARGAPIQNLTAVHTDVAPAWVANPSGRGTWALLYSCVFTLVLCVWTSIHLNVPPQDDTPLKYWMRKVRWVLCALFAPEVVVFAAFLQWFQAWTFLGELKKLAESGQSDETKKHDKTSKAKPPYNMIYAYYVVMGGLTVDISHLHENLSRATITTNGVLFLADHGYFIPIPKESIQDKSKADVLAKGLVIVQVLWVVGQTIERKAAGYPITLLEVHTTVHIVCALILYALWFRKPQDVHDPALISAEKFQDALAFMVLCSDFKSHLEYTQTFEEAYYGNDAVIFRDLEKGPCITPHWWWYGNIDQNPIPDDPGTLYGPPGHAWSRRVELSADQQQSGQIVTHYKSTGQDSQGTTRDYTAFNILGVITLAGDPPPDAVLTIYSGQALASGLGPGFLRKDRRSNCKDRRSNCKNFGAYPSATDYGVKVTVSQKQLTKLNMAGVFMKSNISSGSIHNRPVFPSKLSIRGYHDRLLCFREANTKRTLVNYINDKGHGYKLSLVPAMALLPTAYSGVHLGALSVMFPTPIERLLWIIACYILIGYTAALTVTSFYRRAAEFLLDYTEDDNFFSSIVKMMKWSVDLIVYADGSVTKLGIVLNNLSVLVAAAARVYIVVESFISLRHVPIGVYQTPDSNFMDYVPHL